MSESTNINVIVRCRGRNEREVQAKSSIIVNVPDVTGSNEVSINTSRGSSLNDPNNYRTYTVDDVYGPSADQKTLFQGVAEPLFKQFLQGYNCTIFAYGQTGTGKTYTMCGDDKDIGGTYSSEAGIIPRVLFELFDSLESKSEDYIVKCSFMELYNEDLRDLLGEDPNAKLKIFESKNITSNASSNFNNKNSIIIQNLEEVYLKSSHHGLKVLQKGLKLRRVASTRLNDTSSRSHTIFTLNLYKKLEGSVEEYKVAKMNMVDLAGSENISRSGAMNQRAREAGVINQSLLTLGRVINSLVVENNSNTNLSHIPYRESKLTRLLQDSLGGRTKTVLIATISPAKVNVEETSSTLEYASKAKNIRNKPQIGNLVTKDILVKSIALELSKLKSDLVATRQKNGIFLSKENYDEMINNNENYETELLENKRKIDSMKSQLDSITSNLLSEKSKSKELSNQANELQNKLEEMNSTVEIQQTKELKLIDDLKRIESIGKTLENTIQSLESNHESMRQFIMETVNSGLTCQIQTLSDIIDTNGSKLDNTQVDTDIEAVKKQIGVIVSKLQKSASDACENVSRSLVDQFPKIIQEFKESLNGFRSLTEGAKSAIKGLDTLNKSNEEFLGKLDAHLGEGYTNKMRVLRAEQTKNLEQQQHEFLDKMMALIREQQVSDSVVFDKLVNSNIRIVDEERAQLNEHKSRWNKGMEDIKESLLPTIASIGSDSINLRQDLSQKLDKTNQLNEVSKLSIDGELSKINSLIHELNPIEGMKSTDLFKHLSAIQGKFAELSEHNRALSSQLTEVNGELGVIQKGSRLEVQKTWRERSKSPRRGERSPTKDIVNTPSKILLASIQPLGESNLAPNKKSMIPRASPKKLRDESDKENSVESYPRKRKSTGRNEPSTSKRQTLNGSGSLNRDLSRTLKRARSFAGKSGI